MKRITRMLAVLLVMCLLTAGGAVLAEGQVTFLLPINYFCVDEGQTVSTQDQLDDHSKDGLMYEFTDDGQIRCTVTDQAAALQAVLLDMEKTFAEAQDPNGAMYAKSFLTLEHNADLSEITVTCKKEDWGFLDSFYGMFFLANARDYQLYTGVAANELKSVVRFVDENGEEIYTDDLAEYMDTEAEEVSVEVEEEPAAAGPAEPSSTGDGKMPYDQVLRLIKWIDDGYFKNKTYEEIVAFTGVEGLDKGHRDTSMTALGDHYFDWIADSDATHYIHVCFRGRDDSGRFEACQWNTSGFKSEEWADVDLTDWLTATASHDTAEVSLEIQRFSNPLVTVTAQMPVTGWNTRVSSNTAYFYNEHGERNNDPRIEVTTFDDPAMFDFYLDQYENLQPAPSRVIAGVEMQGRTYHTIGWDWTEYSAQMSEKVSICVRISRVNCSAGTEGGALLDSLRFSWTEKDGTAYVFPGSAALNATIAKPVPQITEAPAPAATEAPVVTEMPAKAAPVQTEGLSAYAGTWYGTWLKAGPTEGDPRKLFSLSIVLTLNEDGTGDLDYLGSDGGGTWGADEDGVVRYWGEGTALSFLEDGSLCWGSYLSGYMLFSRDPSAEAKVFPADPTAQSSDTPVVVPAPQPADNNGAAASGTIIPVGVKYVATTYTAGGVSMDASILGGEYAIQLNDEGTASFTMAGMEVPGYNWKQAGDHVDVDAYGTVIMTLTMQTDGSVLLDYSGTFTLEMAAQ